MKKIIFTTLIVVMPLMLCANSWTNNSKIDRITEKITLFAMSPTIQAEAKMDFPYSTTKSNLVVGCKDRKQFVYFWFSNSPNLNNTQTKDGYSTIQTRIKIGKDNKIVELTQDWGAKSLFLSNYSSPIDSNNFVAMLKKVDSLLLELNWHGNGRTYFQYSLSGSAKVLTKMQDDCGYTQKKLEDDKKAHEEFLKKQEDDKKAHEEFLRKQVDKERLKKEKSKQADKKKLEKERAKEECEKKGFYYMKVDFAYGCSNKNPKELTFEERCKAIGGFEYRDDCYNHEN